MNISILKVYFKYTFKFEHKYINLECLPHVYMLLSLNILQVYFYVRKQICKLRKHTPSTQLRNILQLYF